jgi:hypothetical protein
MTTIKRRGPIKAAYFSSGEPMATLSADVTAAIHRARDLCETFIQQRVDEIKASAAGSGLPRTAIELDIRRYSTCGCAAAQRIMEEIERERAIAARA